MPSAMPKNARAGHCHACGGTGTVSVKKECDRHGRLSPPVRVPVPAPVPVAAPVAAQASTPPKSRGMSLFSKKPAPTPTPSPGTTLPMRPAPDSPPNGRPTAQSTPPGPPARSVPLAKVMPDGRVAPPFSIGGRSLPPARGPRGPPNGNRRPPVPENCTQCAGEGSYVATVACGACTKIEHVKRTPTDSSYISFNGMPCNGAGSATWMYAEDARQQVANAKTMKDCNGPEDYPRTFGNHPSKEDNTKLDLQSSPPWVRYPLVANQKTPWNEDDDSHQGAGKWRAIYNNNDRTKFDVAAYDKNRTKGGLVNGHEDYRLGNYHARVDRK